MNNPPEYSPHKDPKAENQRQERYLWWQDVLYLVGEDIRESHESMNSRESRESFRDKLKKHLDKIYKAL